jgi:Ca-activated chloride channel family protein
MHMAVAERVLLFVAIAGLFRGQQPQAPPSTTLDVKVESRLVNVAFSVEDHKGNRISGLTRHDFEILDNGRPQPITHFAEDDPSPMTFALLVDVRSGPCGCPYHYLGAEKEGVRQILTRVVRPSDTALLATFGDGGTQVWQPFPSPTSDLLAAISQIGPAKPPGATQLFEAVSTLASKTLKNRPGRKVFVILSAGDFNFHDRKSLYSALKAAKNAEAVIFSLQYLDDFGITCYLNSGFKSRDAQKAYTSRNRQGGTNLQDLAQYTGGRMFRLSGKIPLESFLADMAGEIRQQYAIGFPPPAGGKSGDFHRIAIRCRKPGLTIRARSGYYADATD